MNKIISRGLWGVLFVAGLSVLGATAANAAETTGQDGTASGTQGVISLGAPIGVGGNAISILGDSTSSGATSSEPASSPATSPATSPSSTSGGDATLGGTQAIVTGIVPVTAGGNAVSVLGDSSSSNASSAAATPIVGDSTGSTTTGEDGTASGTQLMPDLIAPIGVSGNSVSVLGDSESTGSTSGTSEAPTASDAGSSSTGTTTGEGGTASGTQVAPRFMAPIALSDNAISVLGDSGAPGVVDPGTTAVTPPATTPTGANGGGTMLASLAATRLAYTGAEAATGLGVAVMALLTGLAATVFARLKQRAL